MTGQRRDSAAGRDALPLSEAARALGLTEEALRMRLRRGRVEGYKGRDGRLYIRMPAGHAAADAAPETRAAPDAVALMAEEIAELRRRLDQADRAQAELRRLLLQSQQSLSDLTHAIAERRLLAEPASSPSPSPLPWAALFWPWLMLSGAWPPRPGA